MKYSVLLNILLIAVIGIYLYTHKGNKVEYTQDIKPPKYVELKPIGHLDLSDLLTRTKSKIEVRRDFSKGLLTVTASDGYKQTTTYDNIFLQPNHNFVFAGLGVDKELYLTHSVGYMRKFYFDSLYIGSYISFNKSYFNSVNAVVGFSF